MEDPARNILRIMLGELLDHMKGAQDIASGIAQKYPEYEAMAEEMRKATDMVAMACELEAYRKTPKRRLMVACAKEGACYSRSEALPFLSTAPSLVWQQNMKLIGTDAPVPAFIFI